MGFVFEQDRVRGGYYWTPVRSEWQCLDLRGRIAAQSNQATRALIRLATTETTLFIYDKELFRDADYTKDVVFEGARVMTANRLAKDGKEWVDIFKQFNRYLVQAPG